MLQRLQQFVLLFFLLIFCFFNEAHGQNRKQNSAPDTVVVVFASSGPSDLNIKATLEGAKLQLEKLEKGRYILEIHDKELMGDNFSVENLELLVKALSRRGPNTRVLFHVFDHGVNNGDIIPALESYRIKGEGNLPGLLNLQKAIVEPMISGTVGFTLLLVDACNAVQPIQLTVNKRAENPQAFDLEAMERMLADSKRQSRQTIKITGVDKNLRGQPLALIRSSRGYLAISTAGPEQQASFSKEAGGYGSGIFFDILINNRDVQGSWHAFLDEYRFRMQSVKLNKKSQIPTWKGKINDRDFSEQSLIFPFEALKDAQVDSMLKKQRSKISREELLSYADGMANTFASGMNGTEQGRTIPDSVSSICVNDGKDVRVYDDLNALFDLNSGTNYIPFWQYRSKRGQRTSLYIFDSLKINRVWRNHNVPDRMYVCFKALKKVKDERASFDTITRQYIFLQVQAGIPGNIFKRIGRFFSNLFSSGEKKPLLVSHVYNIPGQPKKRNPPPPPKDTIAVIPTPPVKTAEDFFLENVSGFFDAFYGALENAANHRENGKAEEDLMESGKQFFENPGVDTFQVSRLGKPTQSMTPEQYFRRFFKEFDGWYDSVHYYFQAPFVPNPGTDGFLSKVSKGRWIAEVEFEQYFEGYKRNRILYKDITRKKIQVLIIEDPDAVDKTQPYRIAMGKAVVTGTKPPGSQKPKKKGKVGP